jgi:hypothetical protein
MQTRTLAAALPSLLLHGLNDFYSYSLSADVANPVICLSESVKCTPIVASALLLDIRYNRDSRAVAKFILTI